MGLLYKFFTSVIKPTDLFLATLFTICSYVCYFYYKHFTRINPLPGPLPLPLIGSFAIFKGDIDAWFHDLNKIYGHNGVFELNIAGNRQIVITRAEYVEKFLLSSVNNHVMRTANNGLLDLFDLEKKGVGLNHDFKFWKFNRQIFSQAVMPLSYANSTSKYLNQLFEEMSSSWMDLKPKDDDSIVIDMSTWMRRFTCDFISLLTTSKHISTIKNYHRTIKNDVITKEMAESEDFVESINIFVSDNQILFVPKILRDLPLIGSRVNTMLSNNYYLYGRLLNIIKRRRKEIENGGLNNDSNQLDLLTTLIVANTPCDPHPQKNVDPSLSRPMTDDEIRGVMFDAFVAGTDTTVNTLCFALYYISHYPNVKKKLFQEIESVFKNDTTRQITLEDLEKLRYCEAIIKEASRIRPTVSMVSRYSNKPDEVAGYQWPSDILFIMYVRGINNNPLYWKDPEKFNPERFYDPQEIENQHKNSFSMFGGGSRICLGRKVAIVEMKTILASLYRKYDVELVDMKAPLEVETSTITICTLVTDYFSPLTHLPLTRNPVTRFYNLNLRYKSLSPDGFEKRVWTANDVYPGPIIRANKGDRIVVNVTNYFEQPASIHWHGMFQKEKNWYDGAPGFTQCPIPNDFSLVYNFSTHDSVGTYWWHSHYLAQYVDGLRGALIIHDPDDPYLKNYDEEYVITLSDWHHDNASNLLSMRMAPGYEGSDPIPDSGLISGKGSYDCSAATKGSKCTPNAPLAVYKFKEGQKYLDGEYFEPYTVEKIPINIGQRYSVIVEANQSIKNYWIRATMNEECTRRDNLTINFNSAINNKVVGMLQYEGAKNDEPTTKESNEQHEKCKDLSIKNIIPLNAKPAPEPVYKIFTLNTTIGTNDKNVTILFINGQSFSPDFQNPTLQKILNGEDPNELPKDQVSFVYDEEPNAVIEIRLINAGNVSHPFHMHGHKFFVLGIGNGTEVVESELNYKNPIVRDTVTSPSESWTVIRFVADNPGVWAFHCHIEWHVEMGLVAQLIESPTELAKRQFPKDMSELCSKYNRMSYKNCI
ncbi:10226_t:CDS:2 [Funneliformis geosporum]|uniref:917_t:CDS:1 n=1 Tax=Funneliformis geosporum TaxID=1117311 RepID=A0A9W4SI53_9GLOM|nr:917_t:CDS:2 [Funneliformis geosporum]CAI2181366.1 10226_t:CDS:2 [Funneliformis geosporum]